MMMIGAVAQRGSRGWGFNSTLGRSHSPGNRGQRTARRNADKRYGGGSDIVMALVNWYMFMKWKEFKKKNIVSKKVSSSCTV